MKKLLFVVLPLLALAVGVGFLVKATRNTTGSTTKPVGAVLDSKGCLECHGQKTLVKMTSQGEVPIYVEGQVLAASTHRYLDCTACHSSNLHQGKQLTMQSEVERCGSCHTYERDLYRGSVHGQALDQGSEDIATCTSCHSTGGSVHGVAAVLDLEATTFRRNIASTCARCHANESIKAKYGMELEVYESYQHSVHGKAMELASNDPRKLNKATCSDCHGSHDAKPVDAPGSRVGSISALAETCARCHRGADENYAKGFVGHKEASRSYFPLVYYGERFFFLFTAAVVFFGVLLVSFEGYRWLVGGVRRDHDDDGKGGS
ncbi:MAG: hypothetical protein HY677_02745 [Chloroflexi bacterium]|nr:hypothetical protein [Chloroflexota bacterium]